ncbi:hypothetical protein EHI8A_088720 [Entamoeba histolytica HM-1:IMSS-B]|uniref:Uncharacterized protein n=6 Tax=Entamoeba histolytica TaxID=5759 RepID=C4MAN8_ENTH1|nr:hypothetical protein EHI_016110 [Entamoeba histolytica HM-1:IMSS]EMD48313.1 Hypothetical protein EHI5A_128230 [Entamoeba histolytica KU27]EMH76103.1 hypothetical protein EHI8A_088720 [Entamoeba histolytica HM-1:IMSS-B]EMS15040.1 hypothetical protein KM1_185290 [Entamoeba histolytica HM-3:IMSS]ENY60337.1 hypothetical protein EHI7A_085900 [Entamoeba histolytica HM-1:IMSS-A]GAT98887.1 hypothetical protein CL6EHI_016110 [Entamoeba histolytica]|eukprot:XP_656414.1 hypothetical protein EHI_016110 [Entamoeba histolytica HM-1:IMSS]
MNKDKEKGPKPNKNEDKTESEKRQWKTKYDDSTIRIRLEKNLYEKLIAIKEVNATQRLSLNKIINRLYDSYITRNPQFASIDSQVVSEQDQLPKSSEVEEKKD